jgi:hypothetical protein
MIQGLQDFKPDLSGIESEVRKVIQEEHRRARTAGLDISGDVLIPITNDTVRRRRQLGKGNGPPLAPDGDESRVVTNFLVTTESHGDRLDISVGYIGMPWIEMHAQGGPHLPKRDVIGIQPEAIEKIREIFIEEVRRQVDEILSNPQSTSPGILGRIRAFFGGR